MPELTAEQRAELRRLAQVRIARGWTNMHGIPTEAILSLLDSEAAAVAEAGALRAALTMLQRAMANEPSISVLEKADARATAALATPGPGASLLAERDAGRRFKEFVHTYLDQHGVPHGDPENQHQKEGCRIGARLDLLFAERDAALARAEADGRRVGWLGAALVKLAAFDDDAGNRELAATGSYSSFDYPVAVETARAALKETP